jgi:hypothetical protein
MRGIESIPCTCRAFLLAGVTLGGSLKKSERTDQSPTRFVGKLVARRILPGSSGHAFVALPPCAPGLGRVGGPARDECPVAGGIGIPWMFVSARRPPALVFHPHGVSGRLLLEVCS